MSIDEQKKPSRRRGGLRPPAAVKAGTDGIRRNGYSDASRSSKGGAAERQRTGEHVGASGQGEPGSGRQPEPQDAARPLNQSAEYCSACNNLLG